MIGTINNFVTKVVDKVKGPLHTWGRKTPTVKAKTVRKTSKRVKKSKRN